MNTSHEVQFNALQLLPEDQVVDRKPITKTLLPLDDSETKDSLSERGFVLYNVLSPTECQHLIQQVEGVGLTDVCENGYRKNYRNNDRLVVLSHELSNLIFNRVRPFIVDQVKVTPQTSMRIASEYGVQGTWSVDSMNECWRFCRYLSGGHFSPHHDGNFVRNETQRSFYTFMIYLNEDFEGGSTNFLQEDQELVHKGDIYVSDPEKIICPLQPKTGSALVFHHPTMHEGAQVTKGMKFMMRTELMYRRVDTDVDTLTEPEREARELLRRAGVAETEGRSSEAVALYRRAFKLSPTLADAYGS